MIHFDAIKTWWVAGQFRMKDRFEFYNMLTLLLDNNVQLNDALERMFFIYSDEGRKKRDITGMVCQDCVIGISNGDDIATALEKWVSYDEYSLIKAGVVSGDLQGAFRKAMTVLDNKKRIKAAVLTCTLYPSMLVISAVYLLNKVSTELIPKLGKGSNPATWNSEAKMLASVSEFVLQYGKESLIALVVFIALVFISMPLLNGRIRFYFDKIPPWSIYRALYGSTFLQNVGAYLSSGVTLPDTLEAMKGKASPWLKRRLEDTLHGVNIGSNLGKALHDAGHDFPDKRAVQLLQVIAASRGTEDVIAKFGERWIEYSIQNLQKTSRLLLAVGIVTNGAIMMLVLYGASGIQDGLVNGM